MSAGAESGAEELEARLWAAVTNFDVAGAREALGLGADPNGGQSKGVVLTSLAISWGRSEPGSGPEEGVRGRLLRELLLAGARVDGVNRLGQTSLHAASFFADEEAARILIEQGARVGAKDARGDTPAHLIGAARGAGIKAGGSAGMARVLAEAGADFKERNAEGASAADAARGRGLGDLAGAMEAWLESQELAELAPMRRAAGPRNVL